MVDVFGIKKKPDPTSEADFYAVVSAIAQFIEKVDQGRSSDLGKIRKDDLNDGSQS